MAHYAVFMYAPSDDGGVEPTPEDLAVHDRHAEALRSSGASRAAFALEDPATATSIRGNVITDGPFLEAKEIIVGVYVIEVPDLDAALAIARQNPILQQGGGVEVRPIAGISF